MLKKIGKYEIRLQIGRGAMGVVYEAWDTLIERRVALKTLRTDQVEASRMPDLLARFKREAQAVGRLSHPHIVTIHDYGVSEGTPYLVMEYISGRELAHDLARGARFPLEDVVRIMTQMLGALGHAHEHGVVHRDLKPANMFLLDDGALKVVDFGIARIDDSDFTVLTSDGAALGTPAYMSPEQVDCLPVDHRGDLFSAGLILYELLVGERPFTGESVHTVKQKVRSQEPLRPSEANPTLSPAWDKVIARALAKKPAARYESARQFAEAVKAAFQTERPHAEEGRLKTAEAAERARREAEARARREAEERTVAIAKPARSRAPTIAAAILVAFAILGAVLYTRQGADDRTSKAEAAPVAAESRARVEPEKRAKAEEQAKADAAKKTGAVRQDARKPGSVFQDCADCPRMVVVPAGEFNMGSSDSERRRNSGDEPQHKVVIRRPFAVGRYEVTFDEWDACVRENGCSHSPGDAGWGRGRRPAINISWQDAKQYAEWLSRRTGKRYRLPTEAEWEYSGRAGTTTIYSTGETIAASQANFGARQTVPVGSYAPNAFGLFDFHGNVWEWTEDCWNGNYNEAPADGSAWLRGDCSQRVFRGGSWHSDPRNVRSAYRTGNSTDNRNDYLGFRLARTLE